jgi:hypothetical protein
MLTLHRFEYNFVIQTLYIITAPSESHEGPTRWMNRVLLSGLIDQTETDAFCENWTIGTNSHFLVHDHGDPSPKPSIFSPDVFLADELNHLLVVVEVAKNQSMAGVLQKMEDIWMQGPGVLGVVIIKIEESPKFCQPAKGKIPKERNLDECAWMAKDWPDGPVSYDGHVWCGRLFTRIIVCIKRRAEAHPQQFKVRSVIC